MLIHPAKVILANGVCLATQLIVTSQHDNLVDTVTFCARLLGDDGSELVSTQVSLDASNYANWDATSLGAHKICADVLGLTLL